MTEDLCSHSATNDSLQRNNFDSRVFYESIKKNQHTPLVHQLVGDFIQLVLKSEDKVAGKLRLQ